MSATNTKDRRASPPILSTAERAAADPQHCRACRRRCKPHVCRGLGNSTIRQIHWIVSGALDRGVMWKWLSVNPAEHADKPALPHPEPRPPSADEAKRIVEEAWQLDSDWGAFIWTKMTIGARRGEMCALHWSDLDLGRRTITIRRALDGGDRATPEKDTKAHQQRRLVLDPETVQVLTDVQARAHDRLSHLGLSLLGDAYVFSPVPDGSQPLKPDTASQRYRRMAEHLGIDTTLKNLRHYSATELINAGVNVRTVAGRLGHGGGGTTTLRVYTAWSSEADQRAVGDVSARMPARPDGDRSSAPTEVGGDAQEISAGVPHLRIASALRGAIESGVLNGGDRLPSEKSLAKRYGVANSTAHRAIKLLVDEGLAEVRPGRGTYVLSPPIRKS